LIAGFVLPESSCASEQLVHHTSKVWLPKLVLYDEKPMLCMVLPM